MTVKQLEQENGPIKLARASFIVASDKLLERHINYWLTRMPDITDKPDIPDSNMMFWTKQKRKSRLKGHSSLGGVCGCWLNTALDYAIEKNKWPVRFKDTRGVLNDLVPEFCLTVWVRYVALMVGV